MIQDKYCPMTIPISRKIYEPLAEKIKTNLSDDTINKLARYVHNELGLSSLDCNYDVNKEKCRICARRKNDPKGSDPFGSF